MKKIIPITIVSFCILVLIVYAQDAFRILPTGNVGFGGQCNQVTGSGWEYKSL